MLILKWTSHLPPFSLGPIKGCEDTKKAVVESRLRLRAPSIPSKVREERRQKCPYPGLQINSCFTKAQRSHQRRPEKEATCCCFNAEPQWLSIQSSTIKTNFGIPFRTKHMSLKNPTFNGKIHEIHLISTTRHYMKTNSCMICDVTYTSYV